MQADICFRISFQIILTLGRCERYNNTDNTEVPPTGCFRLLGTKSQLVCSPCSKLQLDLQMRKKWHRQPLLARQSLNLAFSSLL